MIFGHSTRRFKTGRLDAYGSAKRLQINATTIKHQPATVPKMPQQHSVLAEKSSL
jgi:hypothetical protein